MNAWMAFVSIIAILAIVLVAGGLIALIGHMIIGAFDTKERKPENKREVIDYSQYKQLEQGDSKTYTNEYNFEEINQAKAKREQEELESKEDVDIFKLDTDTELEEIEKRLAEKNKEEVKEVVAEPEVDAEEVKPAETSEDDDDLDSLLSEISNDVIEQEQEEIVSEPVKMSDTLSAYNIDEAMKKASEPIDEEDELDSLLDEEDETDNQQPEIEEVKPVEDVVEEVVEPVQEEKKEDKDDSESVAMLKAQLADLNRQLEEARTAKVEVVTLDMTEEECLKRLETLEERLKSVKKDYKTNMKEYRPLKKVMNDLEKNQTKLRRKETIVAKKKVALYGVNNYVDIDKEKAEKLANELELLDGLRLSVSHCEDVINANKDRFPILERTNQILEDQIAHIEADIESTNETLRKIREKKDGENGENENK